MCTGHQRSEGRSHAKEYYEARSKKLNDQQLQNARRSVSTEGGSERPESKVLDRVRIYIDGYLDNMTDIEMKRIVIQAGGRIMFVISIFSLPLESDPRLQEYCSGCDTHPHLATAKRIEDSQGPYRQVQIQNLCRKASVGRRQHQRRKEAIGKRVFGHQSHK
jgi:hypothetical protein